MYDKGSMTQHMMSEVQRMTNEVMAPWSHVDHVKPAFEEEDDDLVNDLLLMDPGAVDAPNSFQVALIVRKHQTPTHNTKRRKVWIPR